MSAKHAALLRDGFEEYLKRLDLPLEPDDNLLPYEFLYIKSAKWGFMADSMIEDELQEVTNQLHQWRDMLRRWQAWNAVAAKFDQSEAWDLRREFTEPLMHFCLITPSAFRDTITFVATNSLHQIRIHTEAAYKDSLEGDPTSTCPDPKPLSRRQKEARLFKLSKSLTGSRSFLSSLRKLDDQEYRKSTSDYRNLNSHAIGPRIAIGITKLVTRRVVPATRMEEQADGTYRVVTIPGKFVPSYSFGGLEPLDLDSARKANLKQYLLARRCFEDFTALLETHAARLPRTDA